MPRPHFVASAGALGTVLFFHVANARGAEAPNQDSSRGLEWIYLNGEVGFESLGLQTFEAKRLVDANVVETHQTGTLLGAGLGVRLIFLTLGPRFRIGLFDAYQLWTLDGEVGIRIPLGNVEPYFTIAAGYASVGDFSAQNLGGPTSGDVSITGYDIRGGGGLDFYATKGFSIGASLTVEALGLTRPGVTLSKLASNNHGTVDANGRVSINGDNIYSLDGSSTGFGFTGTLVVGLHL